MSKHTTGPWLVHEIPIQSYVNKLIIRTDSPLCEITSISRFTDEDLANAKLIAAAPDLLESLKDAVESLLQEFGEIDPSRDRQSRRT